MSRYKTTPRKAAMVAAVTSPAEVEWEEMEIQVAQPAVFWAALLAISMEVV